MTFYLWWGHLLPRLLCFMICSYNHKLIGHYVYQVCLVTHDSFSVAAEVAAVFANLPVDGDYMRKMAEQSQQRQKEAVKRLRQKREELDRKREQVDEEVRELQRRAETEEKRVRDTKAETELRQEQLTREIELQHRNLALEEELEAKTREHELHLEVELKAQGQRFADEMKRQNEQEEEKQHQWQEKMNDDLARRRQEIDDHRVAMEERLERRSSELEMRRKELAMEQKQQREEVEEERRQERVGWEQQKQQHAKQVEKKRQRLDERQRELETLYQAKVEKLQEQLRAKVEELHEREKSIRAELELKYSAMQRGLEEDKQQLLSKREQLEQEFGQKLSAKESEMRRLMDEEWGRVRAMEDKLEERRLEVEGRLRQRQDEVDRLRDNLQKKFDNERDDLVAKVRTEHEGWSEREKQLVTALEKTRFELATMRDRLAQVQIQLETESRLRGQTEEKARQETDQLRLKVNSLLEEREKEQLKQQEALKQKDTEYALREREWLIEQQRRADDMKKREAEILQRRQELESERHQLEHSYYENWMKRRLAAEEQHLELGVTIPEGNQPDRGPYFHLPDPTEPTRRQLASRHYSLSEKAEQAASSHLEELQKSLEQMLTNYMGAVGQWKAEVTSQLEKSLEDSQRRSDLQRLERNWGDFEHRVSAMIGDMRQEQEQQNQQDALNRLGEAAVESETVRVTVSALQEKVSLLDHQLSSEQSHVAELVDQLGNQGRRIDELQVTRDLQRVEESLERVLDQSRLVHGEIGRQNRMIERQKDDSLQLSLHALSPTLPVESPDRQTFEVRDKEETLEQPRTSTPTKQTLDGRIEREPQILSGRDSGIASTDGRTSSKAGKISKHIKSRSKDKPESSDVLATKIDAVQRQSTQLTSILKHGQSAGQYLGSKETSSRLVDERDFAASVQTKPERDLAFHQSSQHAITDICARDSRQQGDQEEDDLSGNESGSDTELKAVFAHGSPSPEPQAFGQQSSKLCPSSAKVSSVIHRRQLSSSPPRSALLGKFYLGASANQTRPFSAPGYTQFDSTTARPTSESSFHTGKRWQPRLSLQGAVCSLR